MTDIRKAAEEHFETQTKGAWKGWPDNQAEDAVQDFIAGAEWMREEATTRLEAEYLSKKAAFGLRPDPYQEGYLDALDAAELKVRKFGENDE